MKDMIMIQNLTKTYGKHRGVEDVTFSVREGEILGSLDRTVLENQQLFGQCLD